MTSDPALDSYFAEAASWDADRIEQMHRQSRLAWRAAGAGWMSAIASAIALAAAMPLKHVEPFVVRVDNTSGVVDVVPVYTGTDDVDEVVTRYLLTHYVQACESFDYVSAEALYFECGAFHTPQLNQDWSRLWARSNPDSPLNRYRDGTIIRARVRSVTFLSRTRGVSDLAQVRYTQSAQRGGSGPENLTHWIATIQYAYGKPSSDASTRQRNPLGLRVLHVQKEPEVIATAGGSGS